MRKILIAFILVAILAPGQLLACDSDSECGVGGTCIKREKRARGVCYGGDPSRPDTPAIAPPATAPAPEFGPGMGIFNPLANPTERPADACIVTQECPAGMDCVISGPGWGKCMAL